MDLKPISSEKKFELLTREKIMAIIVAFVVFNALCSGFHWGIIWRIIGNIALIPASALLMKQKYSFI